MCRAMPRRGGRRLVKPAFTRWTPWGCAPPLPRRAVGEAERILVRPLGDGRRWPTSHHAVVYSPRHHQRVGSTQGETVWSKITLLIRFIQ